MHKDVHFNTAMDAIAPKYTSLYIWELRVFHEKNSILLGTTDILSVEARFSLEKRVVEQLYTDVQLLNSLHRKLLLHLGKHLGDVFFLSFGVRLMVLHQLRRNFF